MFFRQNMLVSIFQSYAILMKVCINTFKVNLCAVFSSLKAACYSTV
uniref:Uncharacterized protein n=1 Tax=Anguilla anguilla TaxID=7936 RepID=A0A0E9SPT5_ANGAN